MAYSNQPFKRPNLPESEEFSRIPLPRSRDKSFDQKSHTYNPVSPAVSGLGPGDTQQQVNGPVPPTQEEVNWAVYIEEQVQKHGYKPSDDEMAQYQDIANRIMLYQQQQQQQAMARKRATPIPPPLPPPVRRRKKKSKFWLFIKLMIFTAFLVLFWAKAAVVVLKPSYFVPRGKIYILLKPHNFSQVYYSVNLDKIYDEKLKEGFTKKDLNLKSSKTWEQWYADPQYWEEHYLLALPYIRRESLDITF